MNLRYSLWFFALGLGVNILVASFQDLPGYIDADYYFAGGVQLVQGKGFSEPYIWNYIDDPQALPHPSHTYWMPLASIISALGMWITGRQTFAAARFPFILLSACVPVMVFHLAETFTSKRSISIVASLLSVFSLYYAPFMPVTDNYPVYLLLGGLFFFLVKRNQYNVYFLLGIITGLMTLARTDGLIWVGMIGLAISFQNPLSREREENSAWLIRVTKLVIISAMGYLCLMGWWHARNLNLFHSFLTPNGARLLWLTRYEETFTFPASQLTFHSFVNHGWASVVQTRINAVRSTFESAIYFNFELALFPLTFLGIWNLRKDLRLKMALVGWLALYLLMTLIFPFAGQRGSYHHAGAAFQSVWWISCAAGIDALASFFVSRGFSISRTYWLFNSIAILITFYFTLSLGYARVIENGWAQDDRLYFAEGGNLNKLGISNKDVVIVKNPPGFYLATGVNAVMIPYGDKNSLFMVADRFGATYLILDKNSWLIGGDHIYANPDSNIRLKFVGEIPDAEVFMILPVAP